MKIKRPSRKKQNIMEEIEKIRKELEETLTAKKAAANLMDFDKVAELTKKQMELKEKLKKSE